MAVTWEQALGDKFIKKDGTVVGKEAVEGKTIAVYMSAHWCPPCRAFTPELAKFYAEYKKLNPNFEIIFCSCDRSEEDMMSYFKNDHGDYLCFEYNSNCRRLMNQLVACQGIPTLAVFTADGKLITKDGRSKVSKGASAVFAAKEWGEK